MFVTKRCRFVGITLFVILSTNAFPQSREDYSSIFGERYNEALTYINKNHWMSDSINCYGIDPQLATAIVFPELIRYSALRDIIETSSLEVLYVQYGAKYADFSIGRFQIKPSFASRLEKDWNIYLEKDNRLGKQIPSFDTTNIPKNRALRLDRLKQDQWQVKYLIMFLKIMRGIKFDSLEQRLIFLATAYNTGYWYSVDEILLRSKKNFFHTSLLKPDLCYSYSKIALDYYQKQRPK